VQSASDRSLRAEEMTGEGRGLSMFEAVPPARGAASSICGQRDCS
jgi:hypothetical protein